TRIVLSKQTRKKPVVNSLRPPGSSGSSVTRGASQSRYCGENTLFVARNSIRNRRVKRTNARGCAWARVAPVGPSLRVSVALQKESRSRMVAPRNAPAVIQGDKATRAGVTLDETLMLPYE